MLRKALTLLLALAALVLLARWPRLYVLTTAVGYGALAVMFSQTLLPARQPLLSALAQRFHGGLSPQAQRYTRAVTLAWSVFFVLALAHLLLTAWLAPAWLAWANPANLGLAGALFLAEFRLRRWCVTDIQHASFRDYLRFLRRHGLRAAGTP